ncbi:MAG: hypothetical protein NT014_03625 [Candidatus Omnitrophica bacterium]|nr:hypothetical protein [Candidatus Omnitrophota bacterium]
MIKLKGIAASPGISIAKAYKIGKEEFDIPRDPIRPDEISRPGLYAG